MPRPSVKSKIVGPGKFDASTDVKCIGTGAKSMLELFGKKKHSFSTVFAQTDVKEKHYRPI